MRYDVERVDMKLTLTIFGRTSRLELWQRPAPPTPPPAVTAEQREALFAEWEKQRAAASSGTHMIGGQLRATSSSNRSRRAVGFDLNTQQTETP